MTVIAAIEWAPDCPLGGAESGKYIFKFNPSYPVHAISRRLQLDSSLTFSPCHPRSNHPIQISLVFRRNRIGAREMSERPEPCSATRLQVTQEKRHNIWPHCHNCLVGVMQNHLRS